MLFLLLIKSKQLRLLICGAADGLSVYYHCDIIVSVISVVGSTVFDFGVFVCEE